MGATSGAARPFRGVGGRQILSRAGRAPSPHSPGRLVAFFSSFSTDHLYLRVPAKRRVAAGRFNLGGDDDDWTLGTWSMHRELEVPVKNSVRELRAQLDWTQADLADRLGVSRQTVNAIETEKYDPSLPLALKIGKTFRKPVEEIFKA